MYSPSQGTTIRRECQVLNQIVLPFTYVQSQLVCLSTRLNPPAGQTFISDKRRAFLQMLSITYLLVLEVLPFATYISTKGLFDSLLLCAVDYPFPPNLQLSYTETVGDGRFTMLDRKSYTNQKRNVIPLWALHHSSFQFIVDSPLLIVSNTPISALLQPLIAQLIERKKLCLLLFILPSCCIYNRACVESTSVS